MRTPFVSILLAAAVATLTVACQPTAPIQPASVPSVSPTPVQVSLVQGNVLAPRRVIATGDGNVIQTGDGTWISTNTGNVISTGGGNFLGTNTGNVISTGGGNVISTGGGNVISTGGGNVISTGGGNFLGTNTGNFIPGAIGKVISTGGGNVISTGGGNVISTGGGNVISTGGGNVISTGGGNVISTGGGNYRTAQTTTEVDSEPVIGAEVFLADLQGKPIPGFKSSITDPEGHYQIPDVPRGMTFIVVVRVVVKRAVKNGEPEQASLVTIGASNNANNRIDVTLATTYTTAAIYARAAEAQQQPEPKPFVISPDLITALEDLSSSVADAVRAEVEGVKDSLIGEKELETTLTETIFENPKVQTAIEKLLDLAKQVVSSPPPSKEPDPPPTTQPLKPEDKGGDAAEWSSATSVVEIQDATYVYPADESVGSPD